LIIDGVKYNNIFGKFTFSTKVECFICNRKISTCFMSAHISTTGLFAGGRYPPPIIYVCLKCGKTLEHAEEIIIPLLKILYGVRLEVIRFFTKKVGEGNRMYKNFYY
jgi:hypothetical protein